VFVKKLNSKERIIADQHGAFVGEHAPVTQDTRRSTAVTCTGVQTPPRAVATPRVLSALAMACKDVAPLAFICSLTGMTLAAKRPAFVGGDTVPLRFLQL
jgi:hypothetical protein